MRLPTLRFSVYLRCVTVLYAAAFAEGGGEGRFDA